ncbi:lamina-associated polypeptide 2, isoforms beta/delta/epsilon/gamma isoform X1 [Callorhinchus milii]|uniref:lamina-associated polypeptide 2, isoforms beta/delta/epsilon/gamma isoform X1 n=1 Tax=Callorhinchus milii TaxID=7868 RepID=UPI001C3F59B8|nr:lamina-associated polypeptide 2, isoforms beta/delta/epsilon/gamma isoform X1 [Callorhinchus milii]
MPDYLEDPSVLTKERLKSELLAHSVSLPHGEHRKDVYVQLYLQHLTARNQGRSLEFSSDDDEEEEGAAAAARARSGPGARKATKKTDKTKVDDYVDVTELTDEDLKEELVKFGYSPGPIVATTRKVYEKKLLKLLNQDSVAEEIQPNGSTDSDQYSDTEEDIQTVQKEVFVSEIISNTKTHVTRQRKTEYNQDKPTPEKIVNYSTRPDKRSMQWKTADHVISTRDQVVEKAAVKENLLQDLCPTEAPTPTGISATCRKPIRGAAGRPIEFTYKDTPLRSARVQANYFPKVQPKVTQAKPEKSKSKRSVPIWIQIVLLILVAFFLFMVYQAMETNKGNPFALNSGSPGLPTGSE